MSASLDLCSGMLPSDKLSRTVLLVVSESEAPVSQWYCANGLTVFDRVCECVCVCVFFIILVERFISG